MTRERVEVSAHTPGWGATAERRAEGGAAGTEDDVTAGAAGW